MLIFKYFINPFIIPILPFLIVWSNKKDEIIQPVVNEQGQMQLPIGKRTEIEKELVLFTFAHLIWSISTIVTVEKWNRWVENHFAFLLLLIVCNIILINIVHHKPTYQWRYIVLFLVCLALSTLTMFIGQICGMTKW